MAKSVILNCHLVTLKNQGIFIKVFLDGIPDNGVTDLLLLMIVWDK